MEYGTNYSAPDLTAAAAKEPEAAPMPEAAPVPEAAPPPEALVEEEQTTAAVVVSAILSSPSNLARSLSRTLSSAALPRHRSSHLPAQSCPPDRPRL